MIFFGHERARAQRWPAPPQPLPHISPLLLILPPPPPPPPPPSPPSPRLVCNFENLLKVMKMKLEGTAMCEPGRCWLCWWPVILSSAGSQAMLPRHTPKHLADTCFAPCLGFIESGALYRAIERRPAPAPRIPCTVSSRGGAALRSSKSEETRRVVVLGMPSGAVLEGRGSPLQPKGAGRAWYHEKASWLSS